VLGITLYSPSPKPFPYTRERKAFGLSSTTRPSNLPFDIIGIRYYRQISTWDNRYFDDERN
jgi:hypothetical protein